MIQDRLCKTCGCSFQGGPRAYYCPECRYNRQRERQQGYKIYGSVRPLGSIDKCKRCGKDYIVNGGLQQFCSECKPVHTAEYDRTTSLEFYGQHKEKINPVRNVRRQQGIIKCVQCGKEFTAHTRKTTCSPECRRIWKNKLWAESYNRKKERSTNAR